MTQDTIVASPEVKGEKRSSEEEELSPVEEEESPTEPRPQKRRLPGGEVHIFENWCKGCGLCVEFCPGHVLGFGQDGRPLAVYPENCLACRWCELHCPDFAIFITDIVDEDTQSDLEEEAK